MRTDISAVGSVAGPGRTGAADASRRSDSAGAAGCERLLADRLRPGGASAAAPLRWSSHAVDRLPHHRTTVTADMQQRLTGAVDDLAKKGGRESVVLVDDLAFVVSVANRTVITAVGADRMKDHIFTNIDSVAVR